jgi:hypothetical protein
MFKSLDGSTTSETTKTIPVVADPGIADRELLKLEHVRHRHVTQSCATTREREREREML